MSKGYRDKDYNISEAEVLFETDRQELIDYEDGVWYYGDNGDNLYVIEF